MRFLIPIMLIGWVPISLILMATLPRRVSVVTAVVGGWLILPPSSIAISGLSSYTKQSALSFGVLLGTLLLMPDRLLRFRPHWLDLWVTAYCAAPFISSLANGLGAYDGGSAVTAQISRWALPYIVGRIHFQGERSLRDLLVGMFAGTTLLIPFCLYEMRLSPTLLSDVYGLGTFTGFRLGGWRPRVFFSEGLELGLWMSMSVLGGFWLWRSGTFQRLWGLSVGRVVLPTLAVVTVLCRSSGALALLVIGVGVFWTAKRLHSRLALILLISSPLIYVGVRVPNVWEYSGTIAFLRDNFDADRAQSFEFRLQNEDILVKKAMEKPWFGWGGWGRSRVYNEDGRDISVTDGLWIIALGSTGMFGLISLMGMFLVPGFIFIWKYGPADWTSPIAAGQAAAVCISCLFVIDSLLNGFPNGVYLVLLGGLVASLQMGRERSFPDGNAKGRRPFKFFSAQSTQSSQPAQAAQAVASPDSAELRLANRYIELARSSGREGAGAEAVAAWRLALELLESHCEASPGDQRRVRRRLDCLNDFAWFLSTRPDPEGGDRTEAVTLARRTTEAEPKDPVYWNTLALALCREGDDLGALEAAKRAMDLADASTGFDSVVLALARARIGHKDDARRWLAAAKQWRKHNQVNGATLDALIREAEAALGP